MTDRHRLLGGLSGALEFRPLLFMIDRRRVLGSYQSIFVYITMMDRHRLLGGLSRTLEYRPLLFMIDLPRLLGGGVMKVYSYLSQ